MLLMSISFNINFATIIALLVGMGLGALLVLLLYCLNAVQSLNKKVKINNKIEDVTEQKINEYIAYSKECFLQKQKDAKEITFDLIRSTCIDLINNIAKEFYPNSKKPIFELTISETILLDRYIMDKLEELLDRRGLRLLRNLKINTLLKFLNIKHAFDKNSIIKVSKKYKFKKISSKVMKIVGIMNPANWFKNIAVKPTINMLTKKICTSLIETIGQETYHIYSKQAFTSYTEDQELNELLESIDDEDIAKIETK